MEKRTVLFVDDEGAVLNSLKRLLRSEPYESLFAQSGQEALDLLERENIQVIVTDLSMPEMDGLTLLMHIKQKHPDIIRLVLSAHGDRDSILDAITRGNVYRYILKPWDNTELKLTVRQAIERHGEKKRVELLANLVENARYVMIFIVRSDGQIMECNALARSTFGYSKSKMVTQNMGDLFKFKRGEGWIKIADSVQRESHWRGELVAVCKDGREFPVDIAASRSQREGTKEANIICFIRDVSKEREVDRMKSEFISLASHEMRTPLTSIKNAVDIILGEKAGTINESQMRFLSLANRNIDRLGRIINDLLDLSKLESGKIEIRLQEVDLEDPLNTVISSLRPQAEDKSLIIGKEIEVDLPKIFGDKDKIKTIFTHLINNAIKFTPEGGSITVAARLAHSSDKLPTIEQKLNENFIEISVADTGTGIPPHELAKIFDRFYQVQKSLRREIGGSGIGLSIVKDLVEKHRGKIWVESKVGKGSRFVFALPRYIPPNGLKGASE